MQNKFQVWDYFNFNNPWPGNLYLNDQAGKDFPVIFKINLFILKIKISKLYCSESDCKKIEKGQNNEIMQS